MSAVAIVIPGGFSSIAVRNAARLYEPARRLPQTASTLVPFASLIRSLPGWPATPYRTSMTRARRSRREVWDQVRAHPARNLCRAEVASKHSIARSERLCDASEEEPWLAFTGENS